MENIKIKHPKFIKLEDDECFNCYAYVHDYENENFCSDECIDEFKEREIEFKEYIKYLNKNNIKITNKLN
jgi:hypothetical protein